MSTTLFSLGGLISLPNGGDADGRDIANLGDLTFASGKTVSVPLGTLNGLRYVILDDANGYVALAGSPLILGDTARLRQTSPGAVTLDSDGAGGACGLTVTGDLSARDFSARSLSIGGGDITGANDMHAVTYWVDGPGGTSTEAGVTGTFANPTSITVKGGIVTAVT